MSRSRSCPRRTFTCRIQSMAAKTLPRLTVASLRGDLFSCRNSVADFGLFLGSKLMSISADAMSHPRQFSRPERTANNTLRLNTPNQQFQYSIPSCHQRWLIDRAVPESLQRSWELHTADKMKRTC